MTKIRFNRPITDYVKVQKIIGLITRNNKLQLRKSLASRKYLDIGCGPNTHSDFINMDYSWSPNVDVCWDITTAKYPFIDNRFDGIFTEHCLEHISFDDFIINITEFYRILKPGGVLRIVVPDGELYLDIYQRRKSGENVQMPYESGFISPMARINGIFRDHGHLFIYDFETIKLIAEKCGYKNITKKSYQIGQNPALLIETEHRKIESLYLECVK